jgi:hypothetical protein
MLSPATGSPAVAQHDRLTCEGGDTTRVEYLVGTTMDHDYAVLAWRDVKTAYPTKRSPGKKRSTARTFPMVVRAKAGKRAGSFKKSYNPPASVATISYTSRHGALAVSAVLTASLLASPTRVRADTSWLDTGKWSVYEVTTPQDAACYLLVKIPTDAGRAAFGVSLYRQPNHGYIHYIEQGIRWAKGNTTLVQLQVDNNRTLTVQMRAGSETPDQLSAPLAPVSITFVKEELVKGHTLRISTHHGALTRNFSLSGSKEAVDTWIQCLTNIVE